MTGRLNVRLTSARFDAIFAWCVGVLFSVVCTALVLLAAGELGRSAPFVLGGCLVVNWVVLGLLYPGRRRESAAE